MVINERSNLWTHEEVTEVLSLPKFPIPWNATGVSIDSRTLQPGDLYVAIHGDIYDGHTFVADAFAKGAVAAIVDHRIQADSRFPQIVVENTLKALSDLGSYARKRTKATIIAVTGSVGKTSTKEFLRHIFSAFGVTFASPASYNNHWGLPLSLASMPRDAAYGIFEMGMNHRGEIAPLATITSPHISIITTIADAHIGLMKSREEIAQEKSDIFTGKPAPTLAIINQDSTEFDLLRNRATHCGVSKIIGFGKSEEAAVRLIDYKFDQVNHTGKVTAILSGQKVNYTLPLAGEHIALNSLIILALGEALGLDLSRLITQLETLPAVQGRGKQHRLPLQGGEILLIDDAYNANLTSMQAGLSVLAAIPVQLQGRRLAVLGEMLELGDQAEAHHKQLMNEVLTRPIDRVFAVGGPVMEAAFSKGIPSEKAAGFASKATDLIPLVLKELRPGDVVFVKGSKGSYVSKVVDYLTAPDSLKSNSLKSVVV